MLSQKNSHERDKHIKFYDKSHSYTVKNKGGYTSVTTILKKLFEPFNSDAVIENMMNGKTVSVQGRCVQNKQKIIIIP